ncbi:MAG: transglutaminase domain-containing protein [Nocardioidaceae bacterium]|nr:transglutaminase domain-containing protein [Nocardioidaceae bacterium]
MTTPVERPQTWHDYVPATATSSLLAALTTWVTLLAWTKFAERPSGFMVPILFGCLLVAVTGMLLRSARLPAVLVALVQVAVVLLWLHHRLAGSEALLGWLPTPESLRAMGDAFAASSTAAQAYAAPVPRSVPEFYPLMIIAGVLSAVLVDFLAVGLRRAPLAGLPLLALYTAPVSILDGGVSWLKFAAAALCYLFLIAAGESYRLAHWGHQLTAGRIFDSQTTNVSSQAIWSSARKIGLTATGLAVVVPIFVPTLSANLFNGGGTGGDGDGDSVNISNPMVDLKRDLTQGTDVELVRVTTTDPNPSYLRLTVLDSFDGNAWRPSGRSIPVKQRANGLVPRPPGLDASIPSREIPSTVQVSSFFRSRWLPTPYPVASIEAPGDWRYDRTTLDFISAADGQTTAGLTYRLRALDLQPTATDLADADPAPATVFTPYTALPRDLPASVRRLAESVTAGRASKFEMAVALQQWFRVDGGFRYSLRRSSGNGTDDLVKFLGTGQDSRVGYCEQFAAAMAVMGRTLGIPSRVAVGFLRPNPVPGERDTYVYSSHDLHAWPEMYFGGIGWVRFEPTPQSRATDVPSYTTQQVPQAQPSQSTSAPAAAPSLNRIDRSPGVSGSGGPKKQTPFVAGPAFRVGVALLVVLLVLLVVPRSVRSVVRRRRWSGATDLPGLAEAAWSEIRDTALDLRLPWDDGLTPRASAHELLRSFGRSDDADSTGRSAARGENADPEATSALGRLLLLLERARYARRLPADAATADQVREDTERCVAAMRAGVGQRRRTRATWAPASLVALSRNGLRGGGGPARPILSEPGVDRAV